MTEFDKINLVSRAQRVENIKKKFEIYEKIFKSENIEYKQYIRKINNYRAKNTRIKKKINYMMLKKCWFCTWTIEDKHMNKNHLRKLKELYNGKIFIINSDYGKTTKRKHYHGVIQSEEEPKKWTYGFCKFIEIKPQNNLNLAKYINKLSAHAIKETTEKILYSRARIKNN